MKMHQKYPLSKGLYIYLTMYSKYKVNPLLKCHASILCLLNLNFMKLLNQWGSKNGKS